MLNYWKKTMKLALVASVALAFAVSVTAAEKPSVRAGKQRVIEVVKVNPSRADLQNIRSKRQREGGDQAQEPEVHVVKVHVNLPRPAAQGHTLLIGDTKIKAYGPFAEGIYFKIYDARDLARLRRQPVRFVAKDEVTDLGVTFPDADANPAPAGRLPDLREALRGN